MLLLDDYCWPRRRFKEGRDSLRTRASGRKCPTCVVLCGQAVEDLPEAVSGVRKVSTGEVTEDEASEACPILIFAPQNGLNLAEASCGVVPAVSLMRG